MARYAVNTTVPVEKSRMEIDRIVRRYGADEFGSGWMTDTAVVSFRIQNRVIRMMVTLPARDEKRFAEYLRGSVPHARSPQGAREMWEQACRQKWRALALLVKAKLEAVDAGILTIEQAFFAEIVVPETGRTVYETARAQLALAYDRGGAVPLLPGH